MGEAGAPAAPPDPQSQSAIVGALCRVMRKDTAMLDAGTREAVAKLAKEARERGLDANDVERHGAAWWRRIRDAKGNRKVYPPTVKQLRTHMDELLAGEIDEDQVRHRRFTDGDYGYAVQT